MTRIGRGMAAAGIVLAAGVAGAQDRGTGTDAMPGRSPSGPAGTSSPGSLGVGSAAEELGGRCSHQMTGTVKDLDKATGTVSIDVAGTKALELHLPPGDLSGFKTGDQVVVSMGIRESRAGSMPTREPPPREPTP